MFHLQTEQEGVRKRKLRIGIDSVDAEAPLKLPNGEPYSCDERRQFPGKGQSTPTGSGSGPGPHRQEHQPVITSQTAVARSPIRCNVAVGVSFNCSKVAVEVETANIAMKFKVLVDTGRGSRATHRGRLAKHDAVFFRRSSKIT